MTSSRPRILARPERIVLYEEPATPALDLGDLAGYLRETTGLDVETRPEFFTHHEVPRLEDLAQRLADLKVKDLYHEEQQYPPLLGDVAIEERLLRDPRRSLPGILYDGFGLQALMRSFLPEAERSLRVVHVVFTPRLISTFDRGDRVYHARVIVCGLPSIASTSGVVEGPAKPKAFYRAKGQYGSLGITPPTEVLKEAFEGRFIDYDDDRLTEVFRGYALQALFFHLLGDPFCKDPSCQLFNAHWQEEMMHAQLASGELCATHGEVLNRSREPRL
ncbi:MAG: DUF6775 family putative metallopeptidase [Thermoplasmata archaeon]|nr:DUF6775 family putative metallopeptidase [Thermoplasmata archaeon]